MSLLFKLLFQIQIIEVTEKKMCIHSNKWLMKNSLICCPKGNVKRIYKNYQFIPTDHTWYMFSENKNNWYMLSLLWHWASQRSWPLQGEVRGPSRSGKSGTHAPQQGLPLAHSPLIFVLIFLLKTKLFVCFSTYPRPVNSVR